MVSFDVKSLLTNVPISGALSSLEKKLKDFHYSAFEIDELIILHALACLKPLFLFKVTSMNSLRAWSWALPFHLF